MVAIFVLAVSILLQFSAAVLALRLIRVTGRRTAWVLIATAVFFMTVRRCITLFGLISGDLARPPDLSAEWVALVISALMVAGIARIAPLFLSIRHSEETLRESEQRFRDVARTTGDWIWEVDAEGRYTYASPVVEQVLGYTPEEVLGKHYYDFFHPDAREELEALTQETFRREEPFVRLANPNVHKDGHTVILETAGLPLTDGEGNLLGYRGVDRDVTARVRAEEEIRQRTAQLEALRQVGLEITTELDLEALLHSVVSRATELLEGVSGGLYLYRPERDVLEWSVAIGPEMAPVGTILHRGEGLSGKIWETGEPLIVDDYQHWEGRAAAWEGYPVTAILGVPIRWGEEFLGVLNVRADGPRTFSPADANLLGLFATQAAIAIQNARLYGEAQHRAEEREGLARIAALASSTLEIDELIEQIMGETMRLLGSRGGMLLLLDEEQGELTARYLKSPYLTEEIEASWRIPLDAPGFENSIFARGGSYFCNDVESDPNILPAYRPHIRAVRIHNFAGVALRLKDRSIGELYVGERPSDFGLEDTRLLRTVAGYVTNSIENARLYQAEQRGREVAEALQETARVVNASLNLDEVLPLILEQLAQVIAYDSSAVSLLDDGHFKVTAGRGFPDLEAALRLSFSADEDTLFSAALHARRPLVIADAQSDPRWQPDPKVPHIHGWIGAPLIVRDRIIGILTIDSCRPGAYSEEDGRLVFTFANQAAIAIENARLYEQIQQRLKEMTALHETALDITAQLEMPRLLDAIIERASALLGATGGLVHLYDPTSEKLTVVTSHNLDEDYTGLVLKVGEGVAGRVFQTGEALIVDDHRTWARRSPQVTDAATRAMIGLPLKWQERVIGVLDIMDEARAEAFSEQDLRLLTPFANQATIAIQNARLYQEVQDYAGQLEQRVAERTAQLQAQYARLDAILRSATDGIVVTGAGGEIVRANPVAQAWLTQTLAPKEAERLRETIRDLARRAAERPETVLELTGLDLQLNAAPISEPQPALPPAPGEPGGVAVVVIHDVSHLKALDRIKSRFVTNISHELRTPIATAKTYAYLMRRMPERWEQYLESLEREVDWLARLVEDILQISEIDTGRLAIEPRPASLNDLTEVAFINQQSLAQEHGLTLEHQPAEPGPVALMDPQRMMQVLNNLVRNAIQYTPEGGRVVLSTGEEAAEGRVWATMTVADTGMGIPEEDLPHVFDRFFRGEEPREMQISGTGMGLAIVAEIVELHGGRVTVESQVDVGTTFTVWLPVSG